MKRICLLQWGLTGVNIAITVYNPIIPSVLLYECKARPRSLEDVHHLAVPDDRCL